jgi:hypothetical protein
MEEGCLPPHITQAGGPPTVGCLSLPVQYIRSYPPYLDAVFSICNPRTRRAVVTVDPLNMACKSGTLPTIIIHIQQRGIDQLKACGRELRKCWQGEITKGRQYPMKPGRAQSVFHHYKTLRNWFRASLNVLRHHYGGVRLDLVMWNDFSTAELKPVCW